MFSTSGISGPASLAFFLAWAGALCAQPSAEGPLRLHEAFAPGYAYHVSSRVELSGTLSLPPQKDAKAPKSMTVTGDSAIEYDERVLEVAPGGGVQKTARAYQRVDLRRKMGVQPQETTLRPGVRRLVLLRLKQAEIPFSLDGPLLWGEIDLIRTDVFTPALDGLLPEQAVRPGDRWTASPAAVAELTDLERIEEGKLKCRLDEVSLLSGRRHARVSLNGTVRGVNEDGPNRQQLDGYFYFDLQSQHLSYLYLKGVHSLLDKDGKVQGTVEGKFTLTRQANVRSPQLDDNALRGLALEPNPTNTQLLYDNPDLGVKLLYPRRWRISTVRGNQVTLDESGGNGGLLLTLDPPGKTPSAVQFLAQTQQFVKEQKGKVLRAEAPRTLNPGPQDARGVLENFIIEVEMNGQPARLEYFVGRQQLGGFTVAARLVPRDLAVLRDEVERIARSVTITKRVP